MYDHVTIRVTDRAASRRFYDTVLEPLGYSRAHDQLFEEWGDFSIAEVADGHALTRGLHVAFVTNSQDEVDAFYRAGVQAGYESDGAPGLRPIYHERYYGGFLLDPDGNSVEAAYHGRPREGADNIDHLWMRVADLDASRRFYATVAPVLGLAVRDSRWGVAVGDEHRSLTLLAAEQSTENVHLAFPVPDAATVTAFHRVATAAGYRDNGAPGERPIYHRGYYGAFVLDPDGNNVEAVFHKR